MSHAPSTAFLEWALPRLGKRWSGFRAVHGQVESRLVDRLQTLGLRSFDDYRTYLKHHPSEWTRLDAMCRITVSRFYRDPEVFEVLRRDLLPEMARDHLTTGVPRLHVLSIGAASGEEPYTIRILWRHTLRDEVLPLPLHVTATEAQPHMLRRALRGCYSAGSVRNLPNSWTERAFAFDSAHADATHAEPYCLRPEYRRRMTWRLEDVRTTLPDGPFSLILCRNLAFTYFDPSLQRWTLCHLLARLRPGGVLCVGADEALPSGNWPLRPLSAPGLFRHTDSAFSHRRPHPRSGPPRSTLGHSTH